MLYSIVGIVVVIIDQIVKYWVDKNFIGENPISRLIPGVISLVRVSNDGAAFSFLSGGGARIWFIVITAIFALLVILALATNFISGRFGRWCLVLITAGGISNMIDRVLYGYVIDMFKIELFDFAVFNVADIFITVFCIAFIIYILFGGEKERDEDDEFEEDDEEEVRRPARVPRASSRGRYAEYDEEEEELPRKRAKAARPEYDEEEEMPVRRAPRKAAPSRVVEEEEDVPQARAAKRPAPAKQAPAARQAAPARASQPARRERPAEDSAELTAARIRAAKQNDERFAEMFATKEAAQRKPAVQPQRRPAPQSAVNAEDPFAEWEKANARASANANAAYAKAAGAVNKTKAAVSEEAQDAFSDFLAATSASAPKAAAKKPAPAPQPVKPAPKAAPIAEDDFDLDSILNEFK